MTPFDRQRGLTIVELMVAVTLSLVITAVIGTMYVQAARSGAQDDRYARMIENGRFALDQIALDLRMVSFWGEMLDAAAVTTALAAGEDCDVGLFDASSAVLFNNAHAAPATTLFDMAADGCPGRSGALKPGTSQLAVKRLSGVALTAGQTNGAVYLRTNGTTGTFINNAAGAAPPAGFSDWQYRPGVYYIRDGEPPYLCRLRLAGLSFAVQSADECLAEGIEEIHLQYGIDTDADGVANQYRSDPTAAEMRTAVTARVYVLARASDPEPGYTNAKTYNLGDLALPAPGDRYYRRVFNTTVALRNPASLLRLN